METLLFFYNDFKLFQVTIGLNCGVTCEYNTTLYKVAQKVSCCTVIDISMARQ